LVHVPNSYHMFTALYATSHMIITSHLSKDKIFVLPVREIFDGMFALRDRKISTFTVFLYSTGGINWGGGGFSLLLFTADWKRTFHEERVLHIGCTVTFVSYINYRMATWPHVIEKSPIVPKLFSRMAIPMVQGATKNRY
ncbi:hypothetical protein ACJX0J_029608, partial [Zea mays]